MIAEIWKHNKTTAMKINRQKKHTCLDVQEDCKEDKSCQVSIHI